MISKYGSNYALDELFDRLANDPKYDQDTVREARQLIEDHMTIDDFLDQVHEESHRNVTYDDVVSMAQDLGEYASVLALIDDEEIAAFHNSEVLTGRIREGLTALKSVEKEYFDIRTLCIDAGLIALGDGKTSIEPLLRMFLPI